jgi:aconitate hydratase
VFTDTLELDLATSSRRWPGRSGRRTGCCCPPRREATSSPPGRSDFGKADRPARAQAVEGDATFDLGHGDVVIAAITSCTNTSNPRC